ncbi:MAG: ornithine cyclodeaminase family protein [Lachnospiraceae bacterium]
MLLLTKEDIKEVFTMKDAIEADKEAYCLFSQGKTDVPLRTQIQAPQSEGVFVFMPAYAPALSCASLKVVNIFPENAKKNLPTAPAQVLLMDGETGMISSILDGTYVTSLRTGAASGAALDVLARKDAKIGALIGTGSQAEHQLEAMLTVRHLEEVRIYARNFEKTKVFVEKMKQILQAYDTTLVAVQTSKEAVTDADMIITCTSATTPVLDGNLLKPGVTISCIGSYQPHMQEIDACTLTRASKIFFDSKSAVLSEAGDMLIPMEAGIIGEKDFTGDIGEVLLGHLKGRETEEEIVVFKSVGIGAQDLVTAKYIYDKASKKNIGSRWPKEGE